MTKKTEKVDEEPAEEPIVVVHDYDPVRPKAAKKAKDKDDEADE